MHFIIIIFSLCLSLKCTTITPFADECSFSAINVFLVCSILSVWNVNTWRSCCFQSSHARALHSELTQSACVCVCNGFFTIHMCIIMKWRGIRSLWHGIYSWISNNHFNGIKIILHSLESIYANLGLFSQPPPNQAPKGIQCIHVKYPLNCVHQLHISINVSMALMHFIAIVITCTDVCNKMWFTQKFIYSIVYLR